MSASSAGSPPLSRGLVYALIALLCAIWGSTWIVIRGGLADVPPFTGAASRFVVSAVVFAMLAPWLARKEGGARPTWRLTLIMGTCNVGFSYAVVYWTETILPSGLVSVLWSTFPLMLALSSHWWLRDERLAGWQWAGLAAGFGGIVMLFLTDLAALGPDAIPAGLILLTSPAISVVGNVAVKKHGAGTSSVLLNRNGMALGAAMLALLAFLTEGDQPVNWTPAAIGSVAYLALAGSVLAFGLYFWLLRTAPAYVLSLIAYVTPVVALTLGALVGDEPVGARTIGGTALVLVGVMLVLANRGKAGAGHPSPARTPSRPA